MQTMQYLKCPDEHNTNDKNVHSDRLTDLLGASPFYSKICLIKIKDVLGRWKKSDGVGNCPLARC